MSLNVSQYKETNTNVQQPRSKKLLNEVMRELQVKCSNLNSSDQSPSTQLMQTQISAALAQLKQNVERIEVKAKQNQNELNKQCAKRSEEIRKERKRLHQSTEHAKYQELSKVYASFYQWVQQVSKAQDNNNHNQSDDNNNNNNSNNNNILARNITISPSKPSATSQFRSYVQSTPSVHHSAANLIQRPTNIPELRHDNKKRSIFRFKQEKK